MKVAVLGGTGFIGKQVCKTLKENGCEVVVLGRSAGADVYLDLSDLISIRAAFSKISPEYLVHLASPSVQGIYRNNNQLSDNWATELMSGEIIGSATLFQLATELGVKKVVFLSSAAVYGKNRENIPFSESMPTEPHTLYGAIKLATERIGAALVPNFIALRLFQVYGEGDIPTRLVPSIMKASSVSELQLTPCIQVSDLVYVKDVADCTYEVLKSDLQQGTFNLGLGAPVLLKDVVELILELQQKHLKPNYTAKKYAGYEVMYSCADMSLLYSKIGWRPKYSLRNGISDLINENK